MDMSLEQLLNLLKTSKSAYDRDVGHKIVEPSKELNWESQKKYIPKDSNLEQSPSLYISPGTEVRAFPGNYNLLGTVFAKKPNTIFMQQQSRKPGEYDNTLPHEAAHVQQYKAGTTKNGGGVRNTTRDSYASRQIEEALDKKDSESFGRGPVESMAELQGQEAMLPKGGNIFDEYKDVFNTPYKRRLYEQRIFPTHDKMFPREEGSQSKNWGDNINETIKLLQRFIRNKTAQ